jgi:hypothetical protein
MHVFLLIARKLLRECMARFVANNGNTLLAACAPVDNAVEVTCTNSSVSIAVKCEAGYYLDGSACSRMLMDIYENSRHRRFCASFPCLANNV